MIRLLLAALAVAVLTQLCPAPQAVAAPKPPPVGASTYISSHDNASVECVGVPFAIDVLYSNAPATGTVRVSLYRDTGCGLVLEWTDATPVNGDGTFGIEVFTAPGTLPAGTYTMMSKIVNDDDSEFYVTFTIE